MSVQEYIINHFLDTANEVQHERLQESLISKILEMRPDKAKEWVGYCVANYLLDDMQLVYIFCKYPKYDEKFLKYLTMCLCEDDEDGILEMLEHYKSEIKDDRGKLLKDIF